MLSVGGVQSARNNNESTGKGSIHSPEPDSNEDILFRQPCHSVAFRPPSSRHLLHFELGERSGKICEDTEQWKQVYLCTIKITPKCEASTSKPRTFHIATVQSPEADGRRGQISSRGIKRRHKLQLWKGTNADHPPSIRYLVWLNEKMCETTKQQKKGGIEVAQREVKQLYCNRVKHLESTRTPRFPGEWLCPANTPGQHPDGLILGGGNAGKRGREGVQCISSPANASLDIVRFTQNERQGDERRGRVNTHDKPEKTRSNRRVLKDQGGCCVARLAGPVSLRRVNGK
ncbi:hypothetical protein C8R43DRAFT_1180519 [Mycena crocata]|nr:hypothetical protein C8R43DRAFT_1180519 [Mycena crocata]